MTSKNAEPGEWLVELSGRREWVNATGALPAVVKALKLLRKDVLHTSDGEAFHATRVGCRRAIPVDARLAFERAKWTSVRAG